MYNQETRIRTTRSLSLYTYIVYNINNMLIELTTTTFRDADISVGMSQRKCIPPFCNCRDRSHKFAKHGYKRLILHHQRQLIQIKKKWEKNKLFVIFTAGYFV